MNWKQPWLALEQVPVGESIKELPWPTTLTIVLIDPSCNLHDGEKVSTADLPPGSMEFVRTLAPDSGHVWKKTRVNPPLDQNGPIFEIMPRNSQGKGLEFQAGVYYPTGGGHRLIAEAYITADAVGISDAMTVLFCPRLWDVGPEYDAFGDGPIGYSVTLKDAKFWSDISLWDAIHKAAEWLREEADPQLAKHRAQTMQDHGLKGEWGKWL